MKNECLSPTENLMQVSEPQMASANNIDIPKNRWTEVQVSHKQQQHISMYKPVI